METSKFVKYVSQAFAPMIAALEERINGRKEAEKYLTDTMLTTEYSPDLKWGATTLNSSIVAADVVSMDSPLPLKKRDSLSKAAGDLPKLGMKVFKGESDISTLNTMIAQGRSDSEVARKLLDQVPKATMGVKEQEERMFLESLSTGQTVIPSSDGDSNVGIRVDFGYKAENIDTTANSWDGASATPVTDLSNIFDKANANGDTPSIVMLSRKYFNLLRNSAEGKELVYKGIALGNIAKMGAPSNQQIMDALTDEFGATFVIVDRTVKVEKNGVVTNVKPWKEENIILLPTMNVGRLVYGTLAEETNPVAGVTYTKAFGRVLVSKYSKNDPLREYTASQALSLPVIDGVDSIYVLKAKA